MITNAGCFTVGVLLSCFIQVVQFPLRTCLKFGTECFLQTSRLYAFVWINVDLLIWNGVWSSVVLFYPQDMVVASWLLSIGLVFLLFAGALRSATSVPLRIVLDEKENMCTAHLYLKTQVDYFLKSC